MEVIGHTIGYLFPNDTVNWGIIIVLYPYFVGIITGMVAVYATSEFWRKELRELSRLISIGTLPFVLFALPPLLLDLGRAERAFEMYLTPNFYSVMAVFGIVYLTEVLAILGGIWFSYRSDFVVYAFTEKNAIKRAIYKVLSLFEYTLDEETKKIDHKFIKGLTIVELIAASTLSYVVFLFTAVKANPWWNSNIIPIPFFVSGIASGVAMVIILYTIGARLSKREISIDALNVLGHYLWISLFAAALMEAINILLLNYKGEVAAKVIVLALSTQMKTTYTIIFAGTFFTMLMVYIAKKTTLKTPSYFISALTALVVVYCMRWNLVIGAQTISKSLRGVMSYVTPIGGKEGLLAAIGVFVAVFVVMAIVAYFLPPWGKKLSPEESLIVSEMVKKSKE